MTDGFDRWKIREGNIIYSQGPSALSNSGLLAHIFRNHSIADVLLEKYSSLRNLSNLSMSQLEDVVGKPNAESLLASFELGKRLLNEQNSDRKKIRTAKDVYELYGNEMRILDHEIMKTAYVDAQHNLIDAKTVSVGDVDIASVYPRKIFCHALNNKATGIVLVHNHPAGEPMPSENDRQVTRNIYGGGMMLGINLVDHVIVGDKGYYSFRESNPSIFQCKQI